MNSSENASKGNFEFFVTLAGALDPMFYKNCDLAKYKRFSSLRATSWGL